MENEYPLCLYKDGSQLEWEGRSLDLLTVEDAEEEAEAKKDGWKRIADHLAPKESKALPKARAEKCAGE